ncbi:unnamed protein product [Discosporangium mesarthrocarpum]
MGELQNRLAQLDVERKRSAGLFLQGPPTQPPLPSLPPPPLLQVFVHGCVGMAMATVEGRLVDCNRRFEDQSGYTKSELRQLTLLNLTPPSELQKTFRLLAVMLKDTTGKAPTKIYLRAVLKKRTVLVRIDWQ